MRRALAAAWRWLRAACGDDAYEIFRAHHLAAHPDIPLPGRREFFAQEQQRKWSGVNRCC